MKTRWEKDKPNPNIKPPKYDLIEDGWTWKGLGRFLFAYVIIVLQIGGILFFLWLIDIIHFPLFEIP